MATMKGFGIIVPNKETGWITKEIPELGMFDALLSPVAVCPCTSDVAGARVRGVMAGRILGHEAVGKIEAIGSQVKDFKFGDTVVVIGIGPVGLMSVAGAAIRGAGRIIAVGNRPHTRELAVEYGANDTISYKDGPIYDQVMELTGGKPVDSVILAGGNTANMAEAYRMTRCGGTIANIAGQNKDFVLKSTESTSFVGHKNLTGGLCPGGRRRLERLMELIRYGRLNPDKLISHTFNGFDKIEDAFNLMADNPADVVKPIVII